MAGLIVRGISDRYWTEHTGVRTGDGGMSHFWDEKTKVQQNWMSYLMVGLHQKFQLTQQLHLHSKRSEETHSLRYY